MKFKKGLTLIELVVIIAVIGILAAIGLLAANPQKRQAQARDAVRKNEIAQIANALVSYYGYNQKYPDENWCDSSLGQDYNSCIDTYSPPLEWIRWNNQNCDDAFPVNCDTFNPGIVINELVDGEYIKLLPKDPINDKNYFYKYEPTGTLFTNETPACPKRGCNEPNYGTVCIDLTGLNEPLNEGYRNPCRWYWIGAKLEAPADPSKPIYRCTDYPDLAEGSGCKEVSGSLGDEEPQ